MARSFRGWLLGITVFLAAFGAGLAQAVKVRVVTDRGHVRLLPDPRSSVVKVVPKGAVLDADEPENAWFRVFLPREESGYDLVGFLSAEEAEKISAESLIPEEAPAPPEERRRPFSAKVFGGTAYCRVGFPNTVRDYFDRYFRSEAAASKNLVLIEGAISPVHNGYSAGAEFLVEFGRVSLGLGAEYIRVESTGTMSFSTKNWDPNLYYFSMTDRLTVVPVRANIYATVLQSRLGRIRLFGGGGMYFGHFSDSWTGVDEKGTTLNFRQKADASKLGFQAGVEIELQLGKNLALVAEGLGRLAKMDGWTGSAEGTAGWFHPKSGITETSRSGTLYSYELQMAVDGPWAPDLLIYDAIPTRAGLGLNVRQAIRDAAEAVLDLSGTSFRAGLRIRF